MTDFYNRYRALFDSTTGAPLKGNFLKAKPSLQEAKWSRNLQPIMTPDPPHQKITQQIQSRSPALDQFQRKILPKFALKNNKMDNNRRFKTQQYEYFPNQKPELKLNTIDKMNYYQLPRLYAPRAQQIQRSRVLGETNKPRIPKIHEKHYSSEVTKLSQHIPISHEQNQQRFYPREHDRIVQELPLSSQKKRVRFMTESSRKQNRIKIGKEQSRVEKWQNKVLADNDKKGSEIGWGFKANERDGEIRAYQNRQSQLFGVKDNQFAFVNSKLQEIKLSEKYYPRGYINQYRDALYRRRKQKNVIAQRRQKLKALLYNQECRYKQY